MNLSRKSLNFVAIFTLCCLPDVASSDQLLSPGFPSAANSNDHAFVAIPFSEIGAKVTSANEGCSTRIESTSEGARLHADLQKLIGRVNDRGLWIESTEEEGGILHLTATSIRRSMSDKSISHSGLIRSNGRVAIGRNHVTYSRPGITEEYSVTADGLRQDFLVEERPAGNGIMQIELAVAGAYATPTPAGAKLTMFTTLRELAYNRLHVTDARGVELIASLLVASPDKLIITVNDALAVYPVRIDPTFSDADWVSMNPGIPGTDGVVQCSAVDGSGNLYVGGLFKVAGNVAVNNVAKWNGSSWVALGSGINNRVNALAVIGTDIYAAGTFTIAGGVSANSIAKWNGSSWLSLGSGSLNIIDALAVIGTDLYVGGRFTSISGVAANRIAKWNGSSWSTLGSGTAGSVYSLAAIGTELYVGGDFSTAGGVGNTRNIAKWNGSTWSSLSSGVSSDTGADYVYGLAIMGNDVYAGGSFTTAGGVAVNNVAKWNGTVWSPLGTGTGQVVRTLAVSGSDLYAAGNFSTAGGVSANFAKWDGSVWSALQTSGSVNTLMTSGSDVYVGGWFDNAGGVNASNIARLSGGTWSSFGNGDSGKVSAMAINGSDLYVAGYFDVIGGVAAKNIAKWNGSNWSALGSGTNNVVEAVAMVGSDLYAAGNFNTAGGIANVGGFAKWDGNTWAAIVNGSYLGITRLAANGSDLYVGGLFNSIGGVSAKNIAKWNGSAWTALGSGLNERVYALAVSGPELYVGGLFTLAGGVPNTKGIAKWNGTAWSALGTGITSGTVTSLATNGTDVYAGGNIGVGAPYDGAPAIAYYIAKWNGSSWSALGTGVNQSVNALAVSGADLYVAGSFTTAGGVACKNIAKWSGSQWTPLGSGINGFYGINGDSASTFAMAVAGTKLYVGGNFSLAGSTVSPIIAKANLTDTPVMQVVQTAPLGDGGGAIHFGNMAVGSDSFSLSFSIENLGTGDLTDLAVSIDGANSADFTHSPLTSTDVPVGAGASTFTVTFSPAAGAVFRTAAIHITSNTNGISNPFDVLLTGEAFTAPPFADWAIASGLSGPDASLIAKPFNDGVENLIKYAFNMNAAGPDVTVLTATGSSGLPQITVDTTTGEPVLKVEFLRRKGSELVYTPQRSDTLDGFVTMSGTQTVTSINAQWERVSVQEIAPPTTATSGFARVQVTLPQ